MSLPTPATPGFGAFRGHTACECLLEWLPVFEDELLRRGVIHESIDIFQLTGDADPSAGVHSQGGAFDIVQRDPVSVAVARQMGADATWARTAGFKTQHAHGVLRGCPHNDPARYQIAAVDEGFNGLGDNGRGGADNGPRPLSGRTWRQGIEWAEQQQEEDVTPEDIQKISDRAAAVLLARKITVTKPDGTAREIAVEQALREVWQRLAGA
jgi:hypothetical protein